MKHLVITLSAMALVLAACSSAATPAPTAAPATKAPSPAALVDIVETAKGAGSFATLLKAATAAGLVDTLKGAGPFTVFAPTDAAFAKLPAGKLDSLLADLPTLKSVLLYHVVSGKVTAAQVTSLTTAKSVEGSAISIAVKDGKVVLNGSSTVTATDVMASNGVIHVIDTVILPPAMAAKDIVDTAAAAGTFATLLKAATAAALVDTLKGAGPFTIFAPTDAAFAKLPAGTLEGLLANPAKLKSVLLYHVVSGKVLAAQVVGLTSAKSVEGSSITIAVKDGKVVLNGSSTVTATDVMASNGVIHVIDTVILPPGM